MKRLVMRPLTALLCAAGFLGVSSQAQASGFQLWEQDGASIGNYHAGYAAEADNASIAWYNPAGITRFHHQQMALSGVAIVTDFKFRGTTSVTEPVATIVPPGVLGLTTATVTSAPFVAQGGAFNAFTNLHYVTPICDKIGFGFSIDVPFGLKTTYGRTTPARYMTTLTSIAVIDFSPSLAIKMSEKSSAGIGFDVQRAMADFQYVAAFIDPFPFDAHVLVPTMDTVSTNHATSTGYGFHAGLMYEFNPTTRAGISYHSQVVHHFSGHSKLVGPIADLANGSDLHPIFSNRLRTNVKLPPYLAMSYFSRFNPCWAIMGSAIFTQWNTFNVLSLRNVAGVAPLPTLGIAPNPALVVNLPQRYRNTWNFSFGANYYPTDTIIIRGGVGYDASPVRKAYRDLRLPDNDRYAIALGAHFQATPCIGLDVGWSHIFVAHKTSLHTAPQIIGPEAVTANGTVKGGADVLSGQIVWNI